LAAAREYELVLMLDPGQDSATRDALAKEALGMIESGGTLKHQNDWGLRKLAYEIAQRNEADYRWFRFEAPPSVLEQLDHSLKIADGVLRFRIFKVDPDAPVMVPPATDAPAPGASRDRGSGEGRPAPREAAAPAQAEPAAEPEPKPAEPAAEPEPEPKPAETAAEPAAEPEPKPAETAAEPAAETAE
jgi:small subunit ribosomal protein S6